MRLWHSSCTVYYLRKVPELYRQKVSQLHIRVLWYEIQPAAWVSFADHPQFSGRTVDPYQVVLNNTMCM